MISLSVNCVPDLYTTINVGGSPSPAVPVACAIATTFALIVPDALVNNRPLKSVTSIVAPLYVLCSLI